MFLIVGSMHLYYDNVDPASSSTEKESPIPLNENDLICIRKKLHREKACIEYGCEDAVANEEDEARKKRKPKAHYIHQAVLGSRIKCVDNLIKLYNSIKSSVYVFLNKFQPLII